MMTSAFPVIYIARHGETAWSLSGQHTGLTNLPLTERGEDDARRLGERLRERTFAKILTSPLQRASRSCELAGFGDVAEVDRDLIEWDYGQYEGLRTAEVRQLRPNWQLFHDGCPDGESPKQVGVRADRVLNRVAVIQGNVLLLSSQHFLSVLAARWLGLEPECGKYFTLNAASLSALGYDPHRSERVIQLWNDICHLST